MTSVSRLANAVWTAEQRKLIMKLRAMVAHFEDTRDLRLMGGYQRGADAELDRAVDLIPRLYDALKQSLFDPASTDAFQEVARALSEAKDEGTKQSQTRRSSNSPRRSNPRTGVHIITLLPSA